MDISHNQKVLSDQICGNINIACGEETTLWTTDLKSAFGTITVFHGGGCETMNVFINKKRAFSLRKGQTRSVTVDQLKRLSIQCIGGETTCKGKFCIDLHYLQPSSENNSFERYSKEENTAPISRYRICSI